VKKPLCPLCYDGVLELDGEVLFCSCGYQIYLSEL